MSAISARARAILAPAALSAAALLGSCNPYDLLVHDRFEQASFDSDVDILWVVDSSNSMERIREELQVHFGAFIAQFANVDSGEGQELEYDNISEATVAWAEFLINQERFLNYHIGITTTDVDNAGNGRQGNIRSLEPIGGNGCQEPTVLNPRYEQENEGRSLIQDFRSLVDVGIDGSGDEKGLYSAALSICKGMPDSFWDGFDDLPDTDPVKQVCQQVRAVGEEGCNQSFFREGAATVVIVVSDEGDDTERLGQFPPEDWVVDCQQEHIDAGDTLFGECDCRLSWFLDFFESVGRPVVFATIAPSYQEWGDPVVLCDGSQVEYPGPCNAFGANVCAIDFYQQSACLTQGLYTPIEVRNEPPTVDGQPNPDSTCGLADFEAALGSIGAMISNLSRSWKLSVIPQVDSITVYRDGTGGREIVPKLVDSPSGGWTYIPQDRALSFKGEAVPSYDDVIDVYYLPEFDRSTQMDRDLPF
jgi:hypothetical protein